MEKTLAVTKVKNPFSKNIDRQRFPLVCQPDYRINDLLADCGIPVERIEHFNIVVNGTSTNNLSKRLYPGDVIVIIARLHGGGGGEGGKDIGRSIAMIAVMVAATIVSYGTFAAIAGTYGGVAAMTGTQLAFASATAAMASTIVTVGGTLLVNSLLPPPIPELQSAGGGLGVGNEEFEGSPTYGFSGGQTSYAPGRPYPVLYGEYLLSGQVINFWVETDNGSNVQTYKALLFMSEGICKTPVQNDSDILINDVYGDSAKGFAFDTTKGGYDQELVQVGGFENLHQYRNISYQIECGPYMLLHGEESPLEDSGQWGHTLTIGSHTSGSGPYRTSSPSPPDGMGTYCIAFDTDDDYIQWDEDAYTYLIWERNVCISFWYRPTTLDSSLRYIYGQYYNNNNILFISHYYNNKLRFNYNYSGANGLKSTLETKEDLSTSQWYYVELSKVGNWYYLFLDGELQDVVEGAYQWHVTSDEYYGYWKGAYNAFIGSPGHIWSGRKGFTGYIDEFKITQEEGHTSDYTIPTEQPSDDFGLRLTTRGQVDEIRLTFEMPYGCYNINTSAQLEENYADIAIYYRKKNSNDDWLLRQCMLGFLGGTGPAPSQGDIIEGDDGGSTGRGEWYDAQVDKTSDEFGSTAGGVGNPDDLDDPGGILLRNVTGLFVASEDLDNKSTGDTGICTLENNSPTESVAELVYGERIIGRSRLPIRREFRIENIDRDEYEVRVVRLSPKDSDTQHVSDLYWTGFDEILYEELHYPCASLLAVSVEASERIKGQYPNFRALWDRGIIAVPDWFPVHNDYTDFIVVEPNSLFDIMSWRILVTDAQNQQNDWIYKDFTEDHLVDGDFTVYLKINIQEMDDGAAFIVFGLANEIEGAGHIAANSEDYLGLRLYRTGSLYCIQLFEYDGGAWTGDYWAGTELDTDYYITIVRDESQGTYGKAFCYIYSDEARSNLLDTLEITLASSKKDFRYFYAASTWGYGTSPTATSCEICDTRFVREVESSNPAWACYDLLTNERYGEKVEPLNINQTNLLAWADWCDGTVKQILNFNYFNVVDEFENYYDNYTEVDTNNVIDLYDHKLVYNATGSYAYRDFGAGYFNGDFCHVYKINFSAIGTSLGNSWMMANDIAYEGSLVGVGGKHWLSIYHWESGGLDRIALREGYDGTGVYQDLYTDTEMGKDYWLKILRDESIGTNGRLYCYIYEDEALTQLLDTLQLDLHAKVDFRYLYAANSYGGPGTSTTTQFVVEYLNINPWNIDSDSMQITDCIYGYNPSAYKDFGEDFFDEDFTIEFCVNVDDIENGTYGPWVWGMANKLGGHHKLKPDGEPFIDLRIDYPVATFYFSLHEYDPATDTVYDDSYVITEDTDYYITITRDDDYGDYGRLYAYVYSDAERTDLLDTMYLDLHAKIDFRYMFGINGMEQGSSKYRTTVTVSDMKIAQKRVAINGIFDTQSSISSSIEKFAQAGRALVLKTGRKFDFAIEKPEEDDVELFTSGNILEGTNELEYLDHASRLDLLNIEFYNKAKGFDKSLVTIYASDYDDLTRVPNEESMFIWGLISEDMARRYGILRMQLNERLNKTTSHESDVDAIACQVGDVIRKEHESDKSTFGGRLGDQTGLNNFRVKLDQYVGIEDSSELHLEGVCTDKLNDQNSTTGYQAVLSTLASEAGGLIGYRLKVTATSNWGYATNNSSNYLSLEEGKTYRIRVAAGANSGDYFAVGVYSTSYSGWAWRGSSETFAGSGAGVWTCFDETFECPSTEDDWRFILYAVNNGDIAYFDNVSLKEEVGIDYWKLWLRYSSTDVRVERQIRGPWSKEGCGNYPPWENYIADYTKEDPYSHLTIDKYSIEFTALSSNEDAYVYRDYGANYFDSNFVHELKIRRNLGLTSNNDGMVALWSITNTVDDLKGVLDASEDAIAVVFYRTAGGVDYLAVYESDGGTPYMTTYEIERDVDYYLTIARLEEITTYGSVFVYVYSDYAKENLLTTINHSLHSSKKDFRYLFAIQSYDGNSVEALDGIVEHLITDQCPDTFFIGAYEDFENEYTETDPNDHITICGNEIYFASLSENEDAFVYNDFGANYWDGDFEHQVDGVEINTGSGIIFTTFIWAMANDINNWQDLDDHNEDALGLLIGYTGSGYRLVLYELDGGALDNDYMSISINTPYYLTIKRDESVGTYGTLYCYVYGDEEREDLLDTLSVTLSTSKKDFQYLFGLMTYNRSEPSRTITGRSMGININGLSGDQAEFDVFGIGKTQVYTTTRYRVTEIARSVDTIMKVKGIEYDENVYVHSEYDGYI